MHRAQTRCVLEPGKSCDKRYGKRYDDRLIFNRKIVFLLILAKLFNSVAIVLSSTSNEDIETISFGPHHNEMMPVHINSEPTVKQFTAFTGRIFYQQMEHNNIEAIHKIMVRV